MHIHRIHAGLIDKTGNSSLIPASLQQQVIALGNFDGVHLGHQAVITETKKIAKQMGTKAAVLTFEPHPLEVLRPDSPKLRITPFRNKAAILGDLGISTSFIARFNQAFSKISAERFVDDLLIGQLKAKHVVIGYDYIFGHKRGGNAVLLKECLEKHGISLTQVAAVKDPLHVYSSTRIRSLIAEGDMQQAAGLLGRPFSISGRVRHGTQKARELGTPTANLWLFDHLRPKFGVYQALVQWQNKSFPAIVNVGMKPTFGGTRPMLEAHLYNQLQDLYHQRIQVSLLKFIRSEKKFNNFSELKEQIKVDYELVKDLFSQHSAPNT